MADERKKQATLLTAGYIRIQKFATEMPTKIPTDIINVIFEFYFETFMVLKFSSTFMAGQGLQLSEDDLSVTRIPPAWDRKYVLVDIDPIHNGVHCWRVQVIAY